MKKRYQVLMFAIVFLLNLNFTLLRSLRNTLAVVDLGKGAYVIPFYEILGVLPSSLLLTYVLTCLLRRFSIAKVFYLTLGVFVGFFLLFAIAIYPAIQLWKIDLVSQAFSMVFYIMAELWKPALITILFWGLVNNNISLVETKKLYAPLLLSASLGSIAAGPLISIATQASWEHALLHTMLLIFSASVLALLFYWYLATFFERHFPIQNDLPKDTFIDNLAYCRKSPPLKLLSWIVIADYIAYSLGEVIFLDLLKRRFSEPCDYYHYMGLLSSWSGLVTVVSALLITPAILRKCRWTVAALATPLCLLATQGAFFVFLSFRETDLRWLETVIFLGSLQYCCCRAAKYTLFDASKEIAFVSLGTDRMRGKLIIDGICSRFGRAAASLMGLFFIGISGGISASGLLSGAVALGMTLSWLVSTVHLGKYVDKKEVNNAAETF